MTEAAFNSTGFYRYLGEKKLMGCRNRSSGILYVPPRSYCSEGHTDDMQWEQMSGKGKLGSTFRIKNRSAFPLKWTESFE